MKYKFRGLFYPSAFVFSAIWFQKINQEVLDFSLPYAFLLFYAFGF